ncbi:hypothetical protein D3C85_852980 [compost metagenome]
MAQRARFRRADQVHEAFALCLQALLERLERGSHGLHALQRRGEVLGHGSHGVLGEGQEALGVLVTDLEVAHLRVRAGGRANVLGELDGGGQHVTVNNFIEQLRTGKLLGRYGRARDDHVQRMLQADHARQALRATGAGQQAQLHFRQRDLRALGGHAVVTAQGQFQPATHGHRVNRGHDRLGGCLHGADHRMQRRLLRGLRRVEFADVGAARESLAGAGDDDGLDGRIVQRTGQAFDDAQPGAVTQAVDGGIVERDDGNAVLNLILRCHAGSFGLWLSRDSNSRILVTAGALRGGVVKCLLTPQSLAPRAVGPESGSSIHKIARSFNFNFLRWIPCHARALWPLHPAFMVSLAACRNPQGEPVGNQPV